MAWRRNSALRRRLAAITEVTRRKVDHRRWLRERAEGARAIRLAALRANLDPNDIPDLARIAYTPSQLAEQGITPEQDRADAAFIAHDRELAAHQGWAEKVAERMPRFAREKPHGRDTALDAWALARQLAGADFAPDRRAIARRQAAQGRGRKWRKRMPRKLLDQALRRLRDAERRPFGFMLFSRARGI